MIKQEYFRQLAKFQLPTEKETEAFLQQFLLAHSWYKHLSWSEPTDFVFFLDSLTGEWNFSSPKLNFNWNPSIEGNLPDELIEMGSFELTAFIHGSFSQVENEVFQEKHIQLRNDLFRFLIDLKARIKNAIG